MRWLVLWIALSAPAYGKDRAGVFDYYVLALSWSATWCAQTGDGRDAAQCATGAGHGWTLHGLWPQFHRGWPAFCQSGARPPSRHITREMADIMGSAGLAWHQWKKHGSCTGLSAADYFALSRRAYRSVTRPAVLRRVEKPLSVPPQVIEAAFLNANPALERDGVTVTCKRGAIAEVRICLSRDLVPVPCGQDVVRDCTAKSALFAPMR